MPMYSHFIHSLYSTFKRLYSVLISQYNLLKLMDKNQLSTEYWMTNNSNNKFILNNINIK